MDLSLLRALGPSRRSSLSLDERARLRPPHRLQISLFLRGDDSGAEDPRSVHPAVYLSHSGLGLSPAKIDRILPREDQV